jgi:CRISPR-associated exonuclease Cas4
MTSAPSSDETIALSALQRYLFCPRQCALIHVEQIWSENLLTAEGRYLSARRSGC